MLLSGISLKSTKAQGKRSITQDKPVVQTEHGANSAKVMGSILREWMK